MTIEVEKFLGKSKQWKQEMIELRTIILNAKLDEEFKWRLPCYCYKGNNVVIIQVIIRRRVVGNST